jgi:hypothetical protein
VTRSLLTTWRLSGSNRQAMMAEKRPVRTSPYSYGNLFPDELEALAGRMEDARADALAAIARTQRGPTVVPRRERAGQ